MSKKIWNDNNEYADVTTIEQALWHLKAMRCGIRSALNNPSIIKHMVEDDIRIERVEEQVLTVTIDYIKQNIFGVDSEPSEWLSHQEYFERHHSIPSDSDLWYCPHCGSASKYRYNFCHHCGRKLNGDDEVID